MADKQATKKKSMTKSQVYQEVASAANLSKKQVADVFDALTALIKREVSKKGTGTFTLPGLVKFRRAMKKAQKARKGRNPATGEEITIAAKPAQPVLRARVLKTLKEVLK
jgi:nucleoid DNA-binding protein